MNKKEKTIQVHHVWKETTQKHKSNLRKRFRYFEFYDNKGGVYFKRITRNWYKPVEWFGNLLEKILYKLGTPVYDKKFWWIRNNITFQ
jgi:hypothetical protein